MAIAYVNGSSGSSATSSIAATAFSVTTGNAIIVCIGTDNDPVRTVSSISDTAGNTYSSAGGYTNGVNRIEIWFAQNITGNASNVVTITLSGSAVGRIAVHQYSGCATSSLQDTGFAPAGKLNSNIGAQYTTAATTAADGELIVGVFKNADDPASSSAVSGTTLRYQLPNSSATILVSCDRVTTTAGSYTVGVDIGDDINYINLARAFKAAGGVVPAANTCHCQVIWLI